jgi:hypothetical protein
MLGGFTGGDGLLVRPVEPHVEFEVAGDRHWRVVPDFSFLVP